MVDMFNDNFYAKISLVSASYTVKVVVISTRSAVFGASKCEKHISILSRGAERRKERLCFHPNSVHIGEAKPR